MSMPAEQVTPIYDLDMARDFFRMIERDGSFMLQTFDDVPKGVKGDTALAASILWPAGDPAGQQRAWNKILSLYARGAGVFFTVNRTDGTGRKRENIPSIRGAWRENDHGCTTELPLQPSLTVESSPGKFHEYILASDHWPADEEGSAEHRAIEERIIESYGSDPNAKDLSRVLRVPGFLHRKDKDKPHLVRIVSSPGWRYPRQQIIEAFPPVERSQRTKAKSNGAAPHSDPGRDDGEDQRIRDALFRVDATERHVWLTIGMAIEAHYGDAGRSLWDEWSATAPDKYSLDDQDRVWRSFKGSGVTIGTLFHYARHGGWEDGTKKLYEEWCRKQGGQPKDDDEAKSKYRLSARSISYFEDFNRALKLDWVIKNLFAKEHTSYLIAPPGGGKSALLSSAVTYLGVGKDWHGFKIPKRCASVIIPLERGSLVKKRIWAESAREGFGEVPVAVSPGMIDLRSPKCVAGGRPVRAGGCLAQYRYLRQGDRRRRRG
jgi:Primase C terminal 2 (PriCT-2)/RepB DNA-primase from phage plasmid